MVSALASSRSGLELYVRWGTGSFLTEVILAPSWLPKPCHKKQTRWSCFKPSLHSSILFVVQGVSFFTWTSQRVSCFLASFWIYLRMYNDIFPTWFWLMLSEMHIESLCLRSDRFYSFYYWTSSLLLRKNYFLLAFDLHLSPFFVVEPGVVGHSCFCAKLICFFTFAFIVTSLNYSLPSNPMWFCSVFFPKQLGSMVICFFFARSGYCFMLIPWKNYCTTQVNGKHTTQKCNFFSYREALIHFKYSHLKNSI